MCKFRNFEKYEVYPDGRIYSYKSKKFLKPYTNQYGYQQIQLSDNVGKIKTYSVHRVVWESVTGEPIPEGYEINHRNEIKTDNRFFENLELVSHKENCNYGTRNERIGNTKSKVLTNNPNISKQVGAFKDGKLILTFQSTQEAGRQGFNHSAVAACCRGELKTHKGYTWRYI